MLRHVAVKGTVSSFVFIFGSQGRVQKNVSFFLKGDVRTFT